MNISVAIATYNGEQYISEQLDSILLDLDNDDEIIISDDGSTDNTICIINQYIKKNKNIRLIPGPQKGVFSNFENALLHCEKEIVCFSDQDDIWIKGKRNGIVDIFLSKPAINIVIHNGYIFAGQNIIDDDLVNYKNGVFKNICKSCYWGCCMAMRKSFIRQYLPFGINTGIAHDQLVGLLGEYTNSSFFLNEAYTGHRVHGNNQTKPRSIQEKILFRFKLFNEFVYVVINHYFRSKNII